MRAEPDGRVGVVVADDHPVFRSGVERALSECADVMLLDSAEDGPSALALLDLHRPDVAVLDIRMPGLDGLDVLRAARDRGLLTAVVFLSAHTDAAVAHAALGAGALGYLTKDADEHEIHSAVLGAAKGTVTVSKEMQSTLVAQIGDIGRRRGALSQRERQILTLIAEGRSGPEVAERLHLSQATVKTYLRRIYEKLQVPNSNAAVAEGLRRGLLT